MLQSTFRSSKVLPGSPFDQNGYCHIHSNVKLAEKNSGHWRVIQEACHDCNNTSKPHRSKSSRKDRKQGNVTRAIKQLKTSNTADDSGASDSNELALIKADHKGSSKHRAMDLSAGAMIHHPNETALVPIVGTGQTKSKDTKKSVLNASPTSITRSPNSEASHPSPAFSSNYFSGTEGFPTLPLTSDDLNLSYETIKHSNALVASNRRKHR
jgi:hypothetical protein